MSPPAVAASRRRFPALLIAIVALATIVRWVVVGRDALWLDEGYSWWDAHQPLASLWTLVPSCDPHPPLYFALLHGWIALLGDGTVAMRVLSTLLGVATVGLVYAAGRELDRARGRSDDRFGIGACAALLFALTPFHVYFSIEARPYALMCFGAALLTLTCLTFVRGLAAARRPGAGAPGGRVPRGRWLSLVAGAVIVVWSNNTAVLVLGAVTVAFVALWIVDRDSRSTVVPVVGAGVLVAVLWAPDWPVLIAQAREVTDEFWVQPPSFAGLRFELHYLIGVDSIDATWWIALAIVGGVALIRRRIGWRWALMVGALALLPIVFNVGISYALKPILIARALMGAAPALALALAASVVLIRSRGIRIVAVIALVSAHALALASFLSAEHVKEPWKPVVAGLAATAPHAVVFVVPNELVLPLAHEAKMQGVPLRVAGLPADYPAIDLPVRYPSGKCAPSVVGTDLGPLIARYAAEPRIVLLTRRHNTYDPQDTAIVAMRSAGFVPESDDVFQPGDLRVMRFVRARP